MANENKTIVLLIGETGAGKSTFLNYLANYFLDGSISRETKYTKVKTVIPNAIIPEVTNKIANYSENSILDKTKSQTTKPVVYQFEHSNKDQVLIIDTPGFGDTDSSKDEENLQSIFAEASQHTFISAIALIINGTLSRETTSLKYVLESIKGSVPDSLLNNIVIVFTNCNETTVNFDLKLLSGISTNNIFFMQNNAFSNNLANANDKLWRQVETEWENSMDTIEEFIDLCKKMSQTSAQDFSKMRSEREKMQRISGGLIAEIKNVFQTIDLIEEIEIELKDATKRGETYKNFKRNEKVKVKEMKKTDYFSTACQEHLNDRVCHEHCGLKLKQECDESHFLSCAAASGKDCRVCKCPMKIHYHIYEIPVEVEKEQEVIIQDMKAKYDQANSDATIAQNDIDSNTNLKKKLEIVIATKKKELNTATLQLKSLCKNFNFHEELKGVMGSLIKEAQTARDFKSKKEFEEMANAIKQMITT